MRGRLHVARMRPTMSATAGTGRRPSSANAPASDARRASDGSPKLAPARNGLRRTDDMSRRLAIAAAGVLALGMTSGAALAAQTGAPGGAATSNGPAQAPINTSRSNIKHAAPTSETGDAGVDGNANGPAQAPISTSRSNIKHAAPTSETGDAGVGGNANGPARAPVQTSRSNIKHAAPTSETGDAGLPGGPAGGRGISDQAASGNLTSFLRTSCKAGEKAVAVDGKVACIPSASGLAAGDSQAAVGGRGRPWPGCADRTRAGASLFSSRSPRRRPGPRSGLPALIGSARSSWSQLSSPPSGPRPSPGRSKMREMPKRSISTRRVVGETPFRPAG